MDISFSLGIVRAKLNLNQEGAGEALAATECREHSAEPRASGEAPPPHLPYTHLC